jgi:hypothetical protein
MLNLDMEVVSRMLTAMTAVVSRAHGSVGCAPVGQPFRTVYGVDFSGAKLAGRNTWVAAIRPVVRGPSRLVGLHRLEALAGSADRTASLAHLVRIVRDSDRALWAFDFPFGLPIEVMVAGARWIDQFAFLREWADDAYGAGVECLRRARQLGGPLHIRRLSDVEAKTPFDCYHYRIIYQTFYGMRDVLGPLRRDPATAVLPFQYRRLPAARRVLVESCPASVLKVLGLPHQNYKQTEGGPLLRKRLRTRHAILAGLEPLVTINPAHRRAIIRNGGGDALDAVIAAVGAWRAWRMTDHVAVAKHPRYKREGKMYV